MNQGTEDESHGGNPQETNSTELITFMAGIADAVDQRRAVISRMEEIQTNRRDVDTEDKDLGVKKPGYLQLSEDLARLEGIINDGAARVIKEADDKVLVREASTRLREQLGEVRGTGFGQQMVRQLIVDGLLDISPDLVRKAFGKSVELGRIGGGGGIIDVEKFQVIGSLARGTANTLRIREVNPVAK